MPTQRMTLGSKELHPAAGSASRTKSGRIRQEVFTMVVKTKGNAVVYTHDGNPIEPDTWTEVPISPHIIMALKYGDLEAKEQPKAEAKPAPIPPPAAPARSVPPPASTAKPN